MINSEIIKKAVYDLCVQANTSLPDAVLEKLSRAYASEINQEAKYALGLILKNAQFAFEKKMPLCQDTGQVLVFIKSKSFPVNINEIINEAVEKAYEENFFRKSVVKNAIFNRINTETNTPCIIYPEIADIGGLEIDVLIKGAGSENVGTVEMLSPTARESEIIDFVVNVIKKAGAKACPPYFIGIGIGGTIEYAGILSKKALLLNENIDENHKSLAEKIKAEVNALNIGVGGLGGSSTALDVKILTDFTHIACMPVAVTVNCHSDRHVNCLINEQGVIENQSHSRVLNYTEFISEAYDESDFISVNTADIDKLRSLKQGQNVLLSGEIYTARDVAHKRLVAMIERGEELPFDLKDKVIFYAGPCPASESCVVGSIGPTTSARMDKYASILHQNGVLATIGKGDRSKEFSKNIKQSGAIYFTTLGGIACYLSQKFLKKELIAFEELGTEAICRFEVKDLPLKVALI